MLKVVTRAERTANLVGVVAPFAGVIAAIALLWNHGVDAVDLGIFAVMYMVSAIGVTVGFHRLLTHRAFQTYPWLERTLAIMGSLSVQGSVIDWVADHRKHHAHTDVEGDPHSPHVGHGSGLKGLWHAHTGWLLETQGQADWKRYAADLYEDPGMRRIGRRFPLLALLTLLIPAAAGFFLDGMTAGGAIRGLIWGGLVRVLRPPRDLVGQLDLPFLRPAAVCHRRSFDQRRLALRALPGRVLAPQPPRVPALGLPRAALVGA
jgi:stearoyl-CoA desaturase (Delta-9 desaturase)